MVIKFIIGVNFYWATGTEDIKTGKNVKDKFKSLLNQAKMCFNVQFPALVTISYVTLSRFILFSHRRYPAY